MPQQKADEFSGRDPAVFRGPAVFIVEDDEAVRDSLGLLIRSVGLEPRAFASAAEFLESYQQDWHGCLVLDIRMPGMSGLELQERLIEAGSSLPIVFITGHGDVTMAVRAMRRGALDFLLKPFHDQDLLDRIHQALETAASRHDADRQRRSIASRVESLTVREKEVMDLVVKGDTNKMIAGQLNISQRTVELYRAKVMEKMEAPSLAHLVRLALAIEKRQQE